MVEIRSLEKFFPGLPGGGMYPVGIDSDIKEKLERLRGKRGGHKGSVIKKIKEAQQLLEKITESQEVSDNDRTI